MTQYHWRDKVGFSPQRGTNMGGIKKRGMRWHVPVSAIVAAILFQAMLLLIGGSGGHRAYAATLLNNVAAEEGGGYLIHYGVVTSRPEDKVGSWVISDTTYEAVDDTHVSEEIAAGDCVEVKVAEAAPTVATSISEKPALACSDDDDDDDDDDGDDDGVDDGVSDFIVRYGVVITRPVIKTGSWVVGDRVYLVTDATVVEQVITVGDCVSVKSAQDKPNVALTIVEKDDFRCDTDDDDDGNDDDDEDEFRREWEGSIVSFPPTLAGIWTLAIRENKHFTFTTAPTTRFFPELATSYAVGRWVEVKVNRLPDGTYVADRVRVDDYEMGEIVVRLESAAFSQTLASKFNLVLKSTLLNNANIYLYTTTSEDERGVVKAIAGQDAVIWAEVNYVNSVPEEDGYKTWGWGGKSAPDSYFDPSAYQQIRFGQEGRAYQGVDVVVAVLDTGVYTLHEQFDGKLQLPSLDVIDDDADPSEVGPGLAWGHGTHVAGVIAAMAPAATILPVRVLDENGRGNTFLLAYAIEWAAQQPGVRVINLSLGTEYDSKILRDVIEQTIQQGIIVVAAAGNSGTDQVQYPAGYPDVIGVTAVNSNSQKASFGNYGKGWVDVSAPGVNIMSTMINVEGAGYATWSGTSMSTAFVSGAAALVAEKWDVQAVDTSGILNQLTETGLDVDALNPAYAGQMGLLLDVSAALGVDAALVYIPKTQK